MSLFASRPTTPPEDPEAMRWKQLAQVVELGLANFRKTGLALKEIRDRELFRFEYKSFADCCRDRWKITTQHANRLIDAATFCEEVEPLGSAPTSENQVRTLRALPEEERIGAWLEAANEGGGAAAIKKAVAKRTKAKKAPKPIRIRVPGAWVTIEPNAKFSSAAQSLEWAIQELSKRSAA